MISVHAQYPVTTAKAGCYLCRTPPKEIDGRPEKIVDLGVTIKFEGSLVVCESCLTVAARAVGMISAAEAEELHGQVAFMAGELRSVYEDLVQLREKEADVLAREEWMAGLLAAADRQVIEAIPSPQKSDTSWVMGADGEIRVEGK